MRTLLLTCVFVIAACSREGAAQNTTAQTAGEDACIDEFVQVFEEASDQTTPASAENLCFDGAEPAGPPVFPTQSRRITVEYRNGEYFATQESASWAIGDFDERRRCMTALLKRTTITSLVRADEKVSTRLADGQLARSRETGENYATAIALGAGPGMVAGLPSAGMQSRVESTPFGVDCTRVSQDALPGSSMCSVTMPRSCAASHVMMPIEVRLPSPTGGTLVGKTTSLRTGPGVDSNSWVLP